MTTTMTIVKKKSKTYSIYEPVDHRTQKCWFDMSAPLALPDEARGAFGERRNRQMFRHKLH